MPASVYTSSAVLLAALVCWLRAVDQNVPQPYLDEVFHVPQAQQYCAGHWRSWDPKITTPPGLYLIAASLSSFLGCNALVLRTENAISLVILFYSLVRLRSASATKVDSRIGTSSSHAALNMVLFPPLFFFAALYYTDVASTLSVVVFLNFQQAQTKRSTPSRLFLLYLLGLVTLVFRQTNIFWVAIYPAALTVVQRLDSGHEVVKESMHNGKSGFGDSLTSIVKTSWKMRVVYNPQVGDAGVEDYFKCILSVITGLIRAATDVADLGDLLLALSPYIALLLSFIAFIAWNGSVVLGDKSNHVATLHLPQMLYIWPYIIFFSWPAILPYAISLSRPILARLNLVSSTPPTQQHKRSSTIARVASILVFILLAGIVVRYNTIVHPFTLADNRHYVFYVFRILMRPWWVRYAVIPAYTVSAWLCIQALGARSTTAISQKTSSGAKAARPQSNKPRTAFVLIWLATTALQLITAPLVEPRYFIVPWLIWRLNVLDSDKTPQQGKATTWIEQILHTLQNQRLWLETAWYLIIDGITAYVFLYRGFSWLSEPGKTQRFMW